MDLLKLKLVLVFTKQIIVRGGGKFYFPPPQPPQVAGETSLIASFEVSQTNGESLIKAIREYLSLIPSVTVDQTNSYRIKVSSVRSVENVIKFIQKAPVKLLGHKKLQYLLWIKQLRTIERYRRINIPSKY